MWLCGHASKLQQGLKELEFAKICCFEWEHEPISLHIYICPIHLSVCVFPYTSNPNGVPCFGGNWPPCSFRVDPPRGELAALKNVSTIYIPTFQNQPFVSIYNFSESHLKQRVLKTKLLQLKAAPIFIPLLTFKRNGSWDWILPLFDGWKKFQLENMSSPNLVIIRQWVSWRKRSTKPNESSAMLSIVLARQTRTSSSMIVVNTNTYTHIYNHIHIFKIS